MHVARWRGYAHCQGSMTPHDDACSLKARNDCYTQHVGRCIQGSGSGCSLSPRELSASCCRLAGRQHWALVCGLNAPESPASHLYHQLLQKSSVASTKFYSLFAPALQQAAAACLAALGVCV